MLLKLTNLSAESSLLSKQNNTALLQRGVAVWNNPCGGKTPTRESRFVRIAKLAYHIAQQTLPTYAHPKSRHDYTFPQRVACVMLKIYLNYTYRDQ